MNLNLCLETLFDIFREFFPFQRHKDFIEAFFPDMPIFQNPATAVTKPQQVALELPPAQRTLKGWMLQLIKTPNRNNSLTYFFNGKLKNDRSIYDVFSGLLLDHQPEMLQAMEALCQIQLDARDWDEQTRQAFERQLLDVSRQLTEKIAYNFNDPESSRLFPLRDSNVRFYHHMLLQNFPPQHGAPFLARLIAACAIYADVSQVGRENNNLKQSRLQEKLFAALWALEDVREPWEERVQEGIAKFQENAPAEAWKLLEQAEREYRGASRSHAAPLPDDFFCYQAHLIMDGHGDYANEEQRKKAAWEKLNLASASCPRALYEKAYYHVAFTPKSSEICEEIRLLLEQAIDQQSLDALLLLARLRLDACHGFPQDAHEALALLQRADERRDVSPRQRQEIETLLGRFYSLQGQEELSDQHYEIAARQNNYEASLYLRRKHLKSGNFSLRLPLHREGSICFFNGPAGQEKSKNDLLLASLNPEKWAIRHGSPAALLRREPALFAYGRLVFAMLSPDEEKNLSDTLELIKLLNEVADQQEEAQRDAFIDSIDIYLLHTGDACSLMLDSAMGNLMEHVYFPVHLCDPDLWAANELLSRFPTFLPCMSQGNPQRHIVVLGDDRGAALILRQMIAATYLQQYPTTLSVVGPHAAAMGQWFFENCPFLEQENAASLCIVPRFYSCDMDALPLNRDCREKKAEKELQDVLRQGNYFIITGSSDENNLALAARLRKNLLRHCPDPGMRPFIALRYRDRQSAWIASQVAVSSRNFTKESNAALRYHWTEDYQLHLFGADAAFEADRLFDDQLEKQALRLHQFYCGASEQDRDVIGDFYRRSYNRDSSMAACLGLIYQCFGMNVAHRYPWEYRNPNQAVLGKLYAQALCPGEKKEIDPKLLEKAAAIEHGRWLGFCASRGWSLPEDKDIRLYLKKHNPRHHLEIALLHPYMVAYDHLPAVRDKINHMLKGLPDRRPLGDPQEPNRAFVKNAPSLLGYAIDKEKAEKKAEKESVR